MKISSLDSLIKIAEEEEGEPYIAPESVRHFFDNIATPKRQKYNKEHGFSPFEGNLLYSGFYNDVDSRITRERMSNRDGYSTYLGNLLEYKPGYYKAKPAIRINSGPKVPRDRTAVHEYTHTRNNDQQYALQVLGQNPNSTNYAIPVGTTEDIRKRLEDVYHIAENYKQDKDYDIATENPTTHAEHQFWWMNDAAKELGHLPSIPEYDKFVESIPVLDLKRRRLTGVSGYEDVANRAMRARYRNEAMKALGMNNVDIPGDRVTVRMKPSENKGTPAWFDEMPVEKARQSSWYKLAPDVFESYFSDPGNKKWGVGSMDNGDGVYWFSPRAVYNSYIDDVLGKWIDEKYGEGTSWSGVSDEEAEKYRRALIDVFSNNSQNNAGNIA